MSVAENIYQILGQVDQGWRGDDYTDGGGGDGVSIVGVVVGFGLVALVVSWLRGKSENAAMWVLVGLVVIGSLKVVDDCTGNDIMLLGVFIGGLMGFGFFAYIIWILAGAIGGHD